MTHHIGKMIKKVIVLDIAHTEMMMKMIVGEKDHN
jgi:hypothetical protein